MFRGLGVSGLEVLGLGVDGFWVLGLRGLGFRGLGVYGFCFGASVVSLLVRINVVAARVILPTLFSPILVCVCSNS